MSRICYRHLIAVLLVAFVPAVAAQTADPLAGTEWQLVTLGDAAVVTDSSITLAFADDGTVSGSSGCNTYSSTYTTPWSSSNNGTASYFGSWTSTNNGTNAYYGSCSSYYYR